MCSGICTIRYAAFSDDGTRWLGLDTGSFPRRRYSGSWVSWHLTDFRGSPLRMPPVKPVREPDDRNGHVRFDERGREPERWTSRRERSRKTPLAAGAAGPARHRACPRLYHWVRESTVAGSARSSGRTGSVNVKVEPAPTFLFTQILPPSSSINLPVKVSPRPGPPACFPAVTTLRNS